MRILSSWELASSLVLSVALLPPASEATSGRVRLAAVGNPDAIASSIIGVASYLGLDGLAAPSVMAEAAGKVAARGTSTAPRLQREKNFVLSQGEDFTLTNELSGMFGLTDGKSGYKTKALEWTDDTDKSKHYCEVGTDDRQYIIIAYKPGNDTYAINWLTDADGTIYRTFYADATGSRIVPNSSYAKEFDGQIAYWDGITPPAASVAANAADN